VALLGAPVARLQPAGSTERKGKSATKEASLAGTKDAAHLAHISDTVTAVAEQMEEHRQVQQNILTVLNQLLETNEAQSEMLAEILGAAAQEAGPSPVAQALEALVATVDLLAESQATLTEHIADLPEAIGRQFEISLRERAETQAS
jgi:pantothenate kinase